MQLSIGDDPMMFPVSQIAPSTTITHHIPQNPQNSTNIIVPIIWLTNSCSTSTIRPLPKKYSVQIHLPGSHSKKKGKAQRNEPGALEFRQNWDWMGCMWSETPITSSTSNWIWTCQCEQSRVARLWNNWRVVGWLAVAKMEMARLQEIHEECFAFYIQTKRALWKPGRKNALTAKMWSFRHNACSPVLFCFF